MSWSNDEISEFLTLFEQEPIIWNPKHEGHKDRNAVHDSWLQIQRNFSVNCTLNDLKKKKETLMGTFRKLHSKVKASMKTGSSADNVFKPNWFAYEQMAKFLQSVYNPRKTKNSEEQSDTEYCDSEKQDQTSTNVDLPENSTSITVLENLTPNTSNSNTFEAPASAKGFNSKKRKIDTDEKERRMEEAYNYLKVMRDKPEDDKYSLFSELLCQKLKALDENMRDIAMHEIDCLMFRFKQQQHGLGPVGYFQQQVPSFQSHTQRFQFDQPSHSQPSSGYPSYPYPRFQTSREFSSSPHSHSQQFSGFSASHHSHSQSSPEYPFSPSYSQPSPITQQSPQSQSQLSTHSHSQPSPIESQSSSLSRSQLNIQFSDESYEETINSILKE